MATKKRAKKTTATTKLKHVVHKAVAKPAPKKKTTVKRKSRSKQPNLPRPTFVKAVWGGIAINGRAFVEITLAEDANLDRLAVSVNGKGIWEGQP